MKDLINSGCSVYVACAGAGIGLVNDLWATPGAIAYFVGANVPYAREETDAFLGFKPDDYCSADTALDLAIASYLRAARHGDKPIGVGITAVLTSNRPHKGEHRYHVAAIGPAGVFALHNRLEKNDGHTPLSHWRRTDGILTDGAAGWALDLASGSDKYESHWVGSPQPVPDSAITARILARPVFMKNGARETAVPTCSAIFPGTFNPLHDGHREMARIVADSDDSVPFFYELSLAAPHKTVSPAEILRRVARLDRDAVVTEAALYRDKARLFPGSEIVIGADAALRMLDPAWGPVEPMLEEIAELDTHFLVFDRGDLTYEDVLDAACGLTGPFFSMGPSLNLSSTEIREGSGK